MELGFMGWATAADVQTVTGHLVDEVAVQQATFIIELTSGGRVAALDATRLSGRNLHWLKLAVAYQAAWMVEHPDYFTRDDVTSFTQDGVSATLKPDGLVLSPIARRCLKRLSWRGMRTIQPTSQASSVVGGFYTSDDIDDHLAWKQL